MVDFNIVLGYLKSFYTLVVSTDFAAPILILMISLLSLVIYKLNKSESSKFFFEQLFIDPQGQASTSKLAQIIALIISSWAFVHLTIKGNLTEWYFLTYMTVWVLNRGYSKWVDLQKDTVK